MDIGVFIFSFFGITSNRSVTRNDSSWQALVKIAAVALFVGLVQGISVAGPVIKFSPPSVNFGSRLVRTASLMTPVTITNTGDATLTFTSFRSSPAGNTFAQFNDCGAALAPGASCTMRVQFAPSRLGQINGNIAITDNAPGSPHLVLVTGIGTAPGVVMAPTALEFGAVSVGQTSPPRTITLTNQNAGVALDVNGVTADSGDFNVVSGCPAQLASNASCTITLRYMPSVSGPTGATLSVSDSDSSSPQLAHLGGTGVSGTAVLSPPTLAFANQPVGTTSVSKTVTLTNSGTQDLDLISIVASGDYSQVNTCGTSLGTGATCSIGVTFSPSGQGAKPGFITIADTDATNLQTVTITGRGVVKVSTVTIKPKTASVTVTQTQQFQAFINGTPSTDVSWAVDGVLGGNASVGTINSTGLYTPPQTGGSHVIRAKSNADSSQAAQVPLVVTTLPGVYTFHNDNTRSGQNLNETVLTTGNVNSLQFGKLFKYPVDGAIRATPLYVANVNVAGQGFHNVVYVANEHNSVYAFDADGRAAAPLWKASFIDPANGITTVPASDVNLGCAGVPSEFGISGTPVIDPTTNRIFILARTKDVSGGGKVYHQKLHVLDIRSGAEVSGSPVEIQASVNGFGEGSQQGVLAFDPLKENSRVSLTLVNGVVYMAWASICDFHPYHGWVMGYDASTLQQTSVFNTSPNGAAAGIWQSSSGLTADAEGNLYFETTNGLFTVDGGGTEYGQSVVKLSTTGGNLAVADYFTPYDATYLTEIDSDLSAFGVMLLPDQPTGPAHVMIAGNKKYGLYVLDADNMGHFKPTDNNLAIQSLAIPGSCFIEQGTIFGIPAYWQNNVYTWPCGQGLQSYRFYNGRLSPSPIAIGTQASQYPPPFPSVSANGNTNGIVWGIYEHSWVTGGSAILFAFDAANVSRLLYASTQVGNRDQAGVAAKGPVPLIANGKVYVSTATELDVYGLLP